MQMQLFSFKLDMCIYETFILFGYMKEMRILISFTRKKNGKYRHNICSERIEEMEKH